MEQFPYEEIIGGTERQKRNFAETAKEHSQMSGEELFQEYLVQPNPVEEIAISEAVEYANNIALQYGSKRKADKDRVFCFGKVVRLWQPK